MGTKPKPASVSASWREGAKCRFRKPLVSGGTPIDFFQHPPNVLSSFFILWFAPQHPPQIINDGPLTPCPVSLYSVNKMIAAFAESDQFILNDENSKYKGCTNSFSTYDLFSRFQGIKCIVIFCDKVSLINPVRSCNIIKRKPFFQAYYNHSAFHKSYKCTTYPYLVWNIIYFIAKFLQ